MLTGKVVLFTSADVLPKANAAGYRRAYIPLETCDVSQFAFAAFSRVAAGHKVNSSVGWYISGEQLNLGVCKKHCFHASRAEQTVTKYAIHLGHTLVFEIGV